MFKNPDKLGVLSMCLPTPFPFRQWDPLAQAKVLEMIPRKIFEK
jgi:hypothetical protein